MTKTIGLNLYQKGLSTATDEEGLLDSIMLSLEKLKNESDSHLVRTIQAEVKELRTKFSSSDFKTGYLNSRERALQQFIDDFPSMLGYWNRDLKNVHSNKVYANYFGKYPEDIRGKSIAELLGEKIFALNLPYINGVLQGHPQTFEREIPTPSGKIKSTLANYIPHFVNEEVVGFFVIVTDITEKKQLEEKTKALEISLIEHSRLSSLGQMASGIAHEINNPIAIIYSDACLLLKEFNKPNPDKSFIVERLTEIESTSLRIEKIVDGLRALQVGRSETNPSSCNVVHTIDQVLAICSNRFTRAGKKILWSPIETAVWAGCNEIQVSEILLNILNNAFDAIKMVENGEVFIQANKSEEFCEIKISNNGPQIELKDRENIFLPFFTTKGKTGTGLGLKISRDLARANNGELFISQKPETEFVLRLKSGTAPA